MINGCLSRIRKTVNQYQQDKLTLDDADGNLSYEIIDVIKPAPMKGMAEAHGSCSVWEYLANNVELEREIVYDETLLPIYN